MNFVRIRFTVVFQLILDIFLVLIATILIIIITVLYLRSISIALIIAVAAGLSLGVSYSVYRLIYRIPIFPFMNLMSAFILIGIGCDVIFVLFDTWEQEKSSWLRKYVRQMQNDREFPFWFLKKKSKKFIHFFSISESNFPLTEMNGVDCSSPNKKIQPTKDEIPSSAFETSDPLLIRSLSSEEKQKVLLSEQALTEIMNETLKHAASSMFVTSFTTSAAFFTNMLTNISFVQVFGVFTGTCILLYFLITITGIAAFAVSFTNIFDFFNFFSLGHL